MSRKYHVKHHRSRSHYTDRLKRRGQSSASVRMASLEDLRRIQGARLARTGSLFPGRLDEDGE